MTREQLPLITLVTPSFNQARYLEQTMRSVLEQAYPRLEYIVMDGGSTDGSVQIIRRHERRLAHWESGPDGGQADAIWRGLAMGRGQVLGWVNSDDLLLPGALEAVGRWFAARPRTHLLIGQGVYIDPEGRLLPQRQYCRRITFRSVLYGRLGFVQPASFWSAEAFGRVGGFDRHLRFAFDLDLYLRLLRLGPARCIRPLLAAFRIHPQSKTSTLQDVWADESRRLRLIHGAWSMGEACRRMRYCFHRARQVLTTRTFPIPPALRGAGTIEQVMERMRLGGDEAAFAAERGAGRVEQGAC